ncbi:Acyl-CoA thioesterase YbgC [Methylocella tundrae]|uniref:Acyl-CoA thioesterase YbgC n=1 Tax=Methylocella tundrae TaxID=227605 RepID=A0A8B6MAX2_METTU|nr:tol-pal system-associated acyl-CoA thioesterase [Methylocella tundrae]VTZ51419.1 Acyl-CoA thioesterase YbgC [Methylocella tundrae]
MRHKSEQPASPADEPHRFDLRVYYEDTDFSGVVYHASYLRFLERGRTEFLRALGIGHREIFEQGKDSYYFAVRAMTLDFRKAALMDDKLSVETRTDSIGGASIEMGQKILRGGELLVGAKVKIAVVSAGKPIRLPASLLDKLRAGPKT